VASKKKKRNEPPSLSAPPEEIQSPTFSPEASVISIEEAAVDPLLTTDVSGEAITSEIATGEHSYEGEGLFDNALQFPLEGVDERWLAVVSLISVTAKRLGGHLAHGHFLGDDVQDGMVVIRVGFRQSIHKESLEKEAQTKISLENLAPFGEKVRLQFVLLEEDAVVPPSIAEAYRTAWSHYSEALEKHAQSHPVLQKAIEHFGGQIVDIEPNN
jgi:hypothetical protein